MSPPPPTATPSSVATPPPSTPPPPPCVASSSSASACFAAPAVQSVSKLAKQCAEALLAAGCSCPDHVVLGVALLLRQQGIRCHVVHSVKKTYVAPRQFLVIFSPSSGKMYVLEPDVKQFLLIARPSAEYARTLDCLPNVFVGTVAELHKLLDFMCNEMLKSFVINTMPIPPWREAAVLKKSFEYAPDENDDALLVEVERALRCESASMQRKYASLLEAMRLAIPHVVAAYTPPRDAGAAVLPTGAVPAAAAASAASVPATTPTSATATTHSAAATAANAAVVTGFSTSSTAAAATTAAAVAATTTTTAASCLLSTPSAIVAKLAAAPAARVTSTVSCVDDAEWLLDEETDVTAPRMPQPPLSQRRRPQQPRKVVSGDDGSDNDDDDDDDGVDDDDVGDGDGDDDGDENGDRDDHSDVDNDDDNAQRRIRTALLRDGGVSRHTLTGEPHKEVEAEAEEEYDAMPVRKARMATATVMQPPVVVRASPSIGVRCTPTLTMAVAAAAVVAAPPVHVSSPLSMLGAR